MSRLICVAYDLLACTQPDPDPTALITALYAASALLGTDVRGELAVPFQPHGSTCVLVLAESHLIVSTWPEHRLAHVDLTTCRADTPPDQALIPAPAAGGVPPRSRRRGHGGDTDNHAADPG